MQNSKHIRTNTQLLAAFRTVYRGKGDGKKEMANWFGFSHSAVCNWFMPRDSNGMEAPGVPTGYQYRLHLWCVRHGYVLHPEVFGLGTDGKPLSNAESAAA